MLVLTSIITFILGVFVGSKLYSEELKSVNKNKDELAAMYYKQLDSLMEKNEKLEEELVQLKRAK